MSPATGLLGYRDECCCLFTWECQSRNKTKMVEHKLVSFATIVDCFNFTTTSVVEKHTREKLCHFCRYAAIAKLFCQKMFCPGQSDWSVRMKKFSVHPHYQDIGRNGPRSR